MWKCSCGWAGNGGDLKPTSVNAGVQGMVRTYACPGCGGLVGDKVKVLVHGFESEEDISQEISDAEPGSGEEGKEETGTGEDETGSGEDETGTGEGEFVCQVPDCGKSYKTERGLKNHMKTHETEE